MKCIAICKSMLSWAFAYASIWIEANISSLRCCSLEGEERSEAWNLSHNNFGSEVDQSSSVSAIPCQLANQNLGDTGTNQEKNKYNFPLHLEIPFISYPSSIPFRQEIYIFVSSINGLFSLLSNSWWLPHIPHSPIHKNSSKLES